MNAFTTIASALVAILFGVWLYRRAKEAQRGWRVRCLKAGSWTYEEKNEGCWSGITILETGDYRESPHMMFVYVPDWAASRREEIVARVKSELKSPAYIVQEPNQPPEPTR